MDKENTRHNFVDKLYIYGIIYIYRNHTYMET
jgi:hypothetical protein